MPVDLETKTFRQDDFAVELHLPDGKPYVEARTYDDIRTALQEGLAVYVESSEGRAFFWKENGSYAADVFFLAPAKKLTFNTLEDATEAALELVEPMATD